MTAFVAPTPIAGLGAQTPIGRSVWASAAAARAGLCGFCEHPFMVDTAGEPMRVARAPWIDWRVEGVDRLAALLLPAIDEALGELDRTSTGMSLRLGLALALPTPRPGLPVALGEVLLARIAARHPGRFTAAPAFELGHAAAYPALDAAIRALAAASLDACLVCGVDSYLAPETLEWVEACDQLHGGGALNNAWGFIPGEAAGAVLLATSALLQRAGLAALAEISAVGIGHESKLIKTDDVCIGEGLTRAFRSVLETLAPGELVDNIFCDLNGEPYRADEYGFTALRTREHLRVASEFNSPADCWGDVGAAGGPLHVALAAVAHHKAYARGPLSMTWGSSESGERGTALIRDTLVARGG
jgi:3-oxoacyl-[acyl-carrier-protein] synthase-1